MIRAVGRSFRPLVTVVALAVAAASCGVLGPGTDRFGFDQAPRYEAPTSGGYYSGTYSGGSSSAAPSNPLQYNQSSWRQEQENRTRATQGGQCIGYSWCR